jgi:hypothetical protein
VDGLSVTVAPSPVTRPYALVQEVGRRPNQPGPPIEPILAWVKRKFGVSGKEATSRAYLVARKLHRKGMPGKGFFSRAREVSGKLARPFVLAAIRRWAGRVA